MNEADAYRNKFPLHGVRIDTRVGYEFICCMENGDVIQTWETGNPLPIKYIHNHNHTKTCIYVWHYCTEILGPSTVKPGAEFGWRPAGIRGHYLHTIEPLHIEPSVYWNECCMLHGFIRDGKWFGV